MLSPEQGTRVSQLAKVWSTAVDVCWDEAAARDFLFRPHPMLEDELLPVDVVLRSEFGAELVIYILGRLKYGSTA